MVLFLGRKKNHNKNVGFMATVGDSDAPGFGMFSASACFVRVLKSSRLTALEAVLPRNNERTFTLLLRWWCWWSRAMRPALFLPALRPSLTTGASIRFCLSLSLSLLSPLSHVCFWIWVINYSTSSSISDDLSRSSSRVLYGFFSS